MTKDFVYGRITAFEEAGILNDKFNHCLGIDDCEFKLRADTLRVFRNYYVSEDKDEYFEELVEKGLAAKQNFYDSGIVYNITEKGLEWLGNLLWVKVKY